MISLADVREAERSLGGLILRTPLVYLSTFGKMTGSRVYLKLENLQIWGSFKIRGVTHKIQSHLDRIGSKRVVFASVGNHAQGVALVAREANIPATIIMPVWPSIAKQQDTRVYRA